MYEGKRQKVGNTREAATDLGVVATVAKSRRVRRFVAITHPPKKLITEFEYIMLAIAIYLK
ncbi:hypothetical protein [Dendronalium sp. ChiSLP03b]|uniref:hypothetical protein n=1 Tax=Dendronalium sp. ChiSLP03b TaxID=3075381 RepID=UPI002ADB3BC9|nr:hypothetical protein [Dendronalium sp. ChiSLP03b]